MLKTIFKPLSAHCRLFSNQPVAYDCLSGVRVVDLTRILAGPFCTMLLSDLGAEVIKVEKPGTGDETRKWGPPFVNGVACYFLAVNRNKKSITVDLKKPEGVKIIKDLVAHSDVFVENYVPGKLDAMGLGFDDLKKVNPGLIYCTISGFGSTGPYASRAGLDIIAASIGGLLSVTGPEDGPPCKVGVAATDLTTGIYAKGAILAALYRKLRTGDGTKIDCSLLATQTSIMTNLAVNYLNTGAVAHRRGTAHETIVPYQSFECSDGVWLTVGGGSDASFAKLCKRIFPENIATEIIQDKRFSTNVKRVENREVLVGIISEQFKTKTGNEWLKVLENCGFPYGRVNNIDEVFSDPQVIHNKSVIETTHPTAGKIKLLGPGVKYRASNEQPSPGSDYIPNPPPLLGEHTDYVLKDILQYDSKQVEKLKFCNAV